MTKEKTNLLDAVPRLSEHASIETKEGLSMIALPRFRHRLLQQLFTRNGEQLYTRIQFEEHGTAVLSLIDGKRTVGEIIEMLSEHFNGEADYARRVTLFVSQLQHDGIVRLSVR